MSKKGIVFIGGLAVMALTVLNASAQSLRFSRFEAKVEKVRNIKVDLSTRNARMFRTNLRNAAKEGVNFAGHYVLTGWGCGTNCSEWAIIDARNGKVFFPRELEGVGGGLCDLPEKGLPGDLPHLGDEDAGPIYFKETSRLIILRGYRGGDLEKPRAKCGDYYFEWTGKALKQLKFTPGKPSMQP